MRGTEGRFSAPVLIDTEVKGRKVSLPALLDDVEPIVVLAEPMYHPAGEALLRRQCEVEVLHSPTPAQSSAQHT